MHFRFALLSFAVAAAASATEQVAEDPVSGKTTVHGCYSSAGELTLLEKLAFNSYGQCSSKCGAAGYLVAAAQGSLCYCGDKYPAATALLDDSQCDTACPGYPVDACGGKTAFTVLNTGLQTTVETSATNSSNSTSSVTTASSSATTAPSKGASNTTTTASSTTSSLVPVRTNAAVSQLAYNAMGLAVMGMGTVFLM